MQSGLFPAFYQVYSGCTVRLGILSTPSQVHVGADMGWTQGGRREGEGDEQEEEEEEGKELRTHQTLPSPLPASESDRAMYSSAVISLISCAKYISLSLASLPFVRGATVHRNELCQACDEQPRGRRGATTLLDSCWILLPNPGPPNPG